MNEWKVYKKDGTTEVCSIKRLEYNGEWLGACNVMATITSPTPLSFSIGDYLEYRGERFEINYDPTVIKSSSSGTYGEGFTYDNVKFNSLADELTRCDFLDYVPSDNLIHYSSLPNFSFFADSVSKLAERIQVNLDRIYTGEKKWTVKVSEDFKKDVNITVNNLTCWDALALVKTQFDVNFIIRNRTITIGSNGVAVNKLFSYGKGNGLITIERNAESEQKIITRLRAYGSTKNLPESYYKHLGMSVYIPVEKYSQLNNAVTFEIGTSYNSLKMFTDVWEEQSVGSYTPYKVSVRLNEVVITAMVALNEGNIDSYINVSSSYEKDSAKLTQFIADLNNGYKKLYFEGGVDKEAFPYTGRDYLDIVPNNMAVRNLMLPAFPNESLDPYIDSKNIEELGVREGTVFFDGSSDMEEIYPSMEGMTAEDLIAAGINVSATGNLDEVVGAEQIADDGFYKEGSDIPTFTITLKDIGFNPFEYRSTSGNPTISMKDGMCGAREFEIQSCEKSGSSYILTCNRSYDQDLDLYFPYSDFQIKGGDKFVLLNIEMPDVYIQAASQRLLKAAQEYLANNDYVRYSYIPKIDKIFMARQHDEAMANGEVSIHDTIKEGDIITFEDSDLGIEGAVTIDSLSIVEGDGSIPQYEITLRNDKVVGSIDKIQNQINSIVQNGVGGNIDANQIKSLINTYGTAWFLRKDKPDTAKEKITFEKGIEVGKYVDGIQGGAFKFDESKNRTYLEADVITARVKAYFETLEVAKALTTRGKMIISPAGSVKLVGVDDRDIIDNGDGTTSEIVYDYYRCYFLAEQDGELIDYPFVNGDLVYCKTFNVVKEGFGGSLSASNRYYWNYTSDSLDASIVEFEGKKCYYVKLDKATRDVEDESIVPMKGDVICHRGHVSDPSRQCFIEISTVENNSPSIVLFQGVGQMYETDGNGDTIYLNPFTLEDKDIIRMGWDTDTNQPVFKAYGSMYFGDRGGDKEKPNEDSTYIKFDTKNGLEVKGTLKVGSTIGESKEMTVVKDGLIQSSYIKLGLNENESEEGSETLEKNFVVWAGTSGKYSKDKRGHGIASWFGGDPIDLFEYYNETSDLFEVPEGVRPATGLDRMDGTGYRANGRLWWDNTGKVYADPLSFFVGTDTVGSLLLAFQVDTKKEEIDGNETGKLIPTLITPKAPFGTLTVNKELLIGDMKISKSKDDVIFIDANVVVRGGITMYGTNATTAPTIWEGIPIDNDTIYWDNGVIKAKGEGFLTGITSQMVVDALGYTPLREHQTIYALTIQKNGVDVDTYTPNSAKKTINILVPVKVSELENDSKFATTKDLDDRVSALVNGAPEALDTLKEIADVLEGNVDSIGDIITTLGTKADKATTLGGYGITDAYTSSKVDELLKAINDAIATKWTQDDEKIKNWDAAYGWGDHSKGGYAKKTYVDETFVTIAGTEDVTGVHDFTNGLKIGGIKIRESQDGVVYIEGNLVVKGGVTMYADDTVDVPSFIESLPTAGYDEFNARGLAAFNSSHFAITNGVVSIIGENVGLNESQLKDYLESNGYINSLEGYATQAWVGSTLSAYATQEWVTNQKYLTDIDKALVTAALGFTPLDSAKWTKDEVKTLLGISDWALEATKPSYTTTEVTEGTNLYFTNKRAVDALGETLKSYVTLSGKQTITGEKDFTGGLKVNGSPIVYDVDKGYWYLTGDLIVSGGVTMFGNIGTYTPSTIMDGVVVDGVTIIKQNGKLVALGGGGGGGSELDTVAWGNVLGKPDWVTDAKPDFINPFSLSWNGRETGSYDGSVPKTFYIPTKLSEFTDDVVSGKYLPLSGGVLNGQLGFSGTTYPHIYGNGEHLTLGIKNNGSNFVVVTNTAVQPNVANTGMYLGERDIRWSNIYSVLGNFSGQITSTVADGTAPFIVTSKTLVANLHSATATKLHTPVTLWGQSFDGTGNVSGDLKEVGYIYGEKALVLSSKGENYIQIKYNDDDTKTLIHDGHSFRPVSASNGLLNLGASNSRWNGIYGQSLDVTGNIYSNYNIVARNELQGKKLYLSNTDGESLIESYGVNGGYIIYAGHTEDEWFRLDALNSEGNYVTQVIQIDKKNRVSVARLNVGSGFNGNRKNEYTLGVYGTLGVTGAATFKAQTTHSAGLLSTTGSFSDSVTINGIKINKSQDGTLYINGNLVVSGGVTMYGTDATTTPSIFDSLPIASTSVKGIAQFDGSYFTVNNGLVSLIPENVGLNETKLNAYLTTNGYITSDALTTKLGDYALKTGANASGTWGISVSGIAAKATSDASGNIIADTYLKKSGGTMSGILTSTVANGTAPFVVASKTEVANLHSATATKLHTPVTLWGNSFDGSSSVTGQIVATQGIHVNTYTGSYPFMITRNGSETESTKLFQHDQGITFEVTNDEKIATVFFRFLATDTENSDGTDAKEGELKFGVNFSSKTYFAANEFQGIATSANKLETPRTLWGQSFDGTGNVSGDLKEVGYIYGEKALVLSSKGENYIQIKYNDDDTKTLIHDGHSFRPVSASNGLLNLGASNSRWNGIYGCTLNLETKGTNGNYKQKWDSSIISYNEKYGGFYIITGNSEGESIRIGSCNNNGVWVSNGLRIMQNGYVGIGNINPKYQLHVHNRLGVGNDALMEIYPIDIETYEFGTESIAIQTCFDNQTPSTSDYVERHEGRCNLLLQPRGGQVYVGYTPTVIQTPYSLSVGGGGVQILKNLSVHETSTFTGVTTHSAGLLSTTGSFSDSVTINGIKINKSQDGTLYINGNLVVSGGVTMYGTDTTTTPSIFDSLPIASTSVKGIAQFDGSYFTVNNGLVSLIPENIGLNETKLNTYLTTNGYITSDALTTKLGDYALKTGTNASGTWGISVSGSSAVLQGATSTSSVTMSGLDRGQLVYRYNINNGTTGLFNTNNDANAIIAMNRHHEGYWSQLGFSNDGRIYYRAANDNTTAWNKVAFTSDLNGYLPKTGGTITGVLGMAMTTDTSNEKGLTWYKTDGVTQIASITYHNTGKNIILNPIGSSYTYSDSEGKYSLVIGNNKLTYNTHYIYHKGLIDTLKTDLGLGSNAYTSTAYLPSASYTASDVLAKLKTIDGSGSGLDADMLDGCQLATFMTFLSRTNYVKATFNDSALSTLATGDGYIEFWDSNANGWMNSQWGNITAFNITARTAFIGSLTGNASSASKLNDDSSYSAWGQTFFSGGTPNSVSGNMTGVGSISASGNITTSGKLVTNGARVEANGSNGSAIGLFATGTTYSLGFIIGDGGVNRGIYDYYNGSWMLYRDSSADVYIPYGDLRLGSSAYIGGGANISGNANVGGYVKCGSAVFLQNGTYAELSSGGNEMILSGGANMYVNYRSSAYGRSVPSSWVWNAGSSGSYASFTIGGLTANGNILATGGITMYSQRSLKNVMDERGLSLDELRDIKPTRYTWKDGRDDRLHIGGIADDIEQVLPEVVYRNNNGILTLDYGNAAFAIAASLIRPVIDHETRIERLERENRELKEEIERLKRA